MLAACSSTRTLWLPILQIIWVQREQSDQGSIAPDKAAYCVFMQFLGSQNAIKFISVRTKSDKNP